MNSCTHSEHCSDCISYHDTLLRIQNVSFSYGDKIVLRDVNAEILDVQRKCTVQGQIVALLAPSGRGKTTLFRIIAGLLQPTSGCVTVNAKADPVHAGMVGVVSQQYTLFEHRTVLGNLMLGAEKKYKTRTEAQQQSLAILEKFELADKAKHYPAQLSGGQRQRIAIAQQLLSSDHFLLMDEPFSGLDVMMVEKVSGLLNGVASMDELNTVIVVTHDVSAACCVADHVWLMGFERDAAGVAIPGARIVDTYDLVSMGLCWQENIQARPEFAELVRQIKGRFPTL